MTCEGNIMASKKRLTNGMLVSLGVCMMISYGTFGMNCTKLPHKGPSVEDVLPREVLSDVFDNDKNFKKLIRDLEKKEGFKVKYAEYCCCKGSICDAKIIYKCKDDSLKYNESVSELIWGCLAVGIDNKSVVMNKEGNGYSLKEITGIYEYLLKNYNIGSTLNEAIRERMGKTKKTVNP